MATIDTLSLPDDEKEVKESEVPIEEVTSALKQCSVTTRNIQCGLSNSVAECLEREFDIELLPNIPIRKCQSLSEIFEHAVIWHIDKNLTRNHLLRQLDDHVENEHNYAGKHEELDYWYDSESEEEPEDTTPREPPVNLYLEHYHRVHNTQNLQNPQTPQNPQNPQNLQGPSGSSGFSQGPLNSWDVEYPGSMASSRSNSFSSYRRNSYGGFKKRGRPLGSKNKKDLENPKPPTPAKRGGRGRGGGGRGSRARARKAPMLQRSMDGEGGGEKEVPRSRSRSRSPISPGPSGASDEMSSRRLKKENEELRQRTVKKYLAKCLAAEKNAYFE